MNWTKVHQENAKVKYFYDYPENRAIAEGLTADDKNYISQRTGFSTDYVRLWCRGKRRNRRIEEMARHISRINKMKEGKLKQLIIDN